MSELRKKGFIQPTEYLEVATENEELGDVAKVENSVTEVSKKVLDKVQHK